jgi:predicted component of type VI protein secretion system
LGLSVDSPTEHAEVNRKGNTWVLKISHSRNGMFVNGNMVSFRVLRSGDRIEIAHFVIQFDDDDSGDDDVKPSKVDVGDAHNTTITMSLHDALKIHEINTQVMGAHLSWYGEGEDENIVGLKEVRTLIGSTEECQVQLAPAPGCTGLCAAIRKTDIGYDLEPLAETGSLKVNAIPTLGATRLKDGDRLMWGAYILQFREPVE